MISHSPEETEKIAEGFARKLRGGEKIGLCGALGAGKTRFMQGVGKALPLLTQEPLSSPSFAIMNEYPLAGDGVLYHLDLYRLDTWDSFVEIDGEGLLNRLDEKSFLFIEWADRYPELLNRLDWVIRFAQGNKEEEREIELREIRS